MNTETTKQDAMLRAGYSESMAKKPSVVEQSDGFQLAMATIFSETGNTAMKVLKELQVRDVSKETTKDLVSFFDVMTKAMERLTPNQGNKDDAMRTIFATALDDKPLQNQDETESTIDNATIVLHNNDDVA